jgi:uncharacterized membrane protein
MIRPLLLLLVLLIGAAYSIVARKLTVMAALTGVALALCVYAGAGFTGLAMMTFFFIAGSAATSWNHGWKLQQGLAESEKGTRTAMQVVANAGVPALLGLTGFLYGKLLASLPDGPLPLEGSTPGLATLPSSSVGWSSALPTLLPVMMASAFAAAAADTLSSELGNVYGHRYYNILSLRKDQRGLNGVISLEGTLCGVAGSLLIALIFSAGYGWNIRAAVIITLAGTIGNIADSLLGATFERKHWIGNNAVNFINTAIAALSVLLLRL